MNTTNEAPPITQLEMSEADIEFAEVIAKRLGYTQTAYTSTSGLWGLFCLAENPADIAGTPCNKCQDRPGRDGLGRTCKSCRGSGWIKPPIPNGQTRKGCIIKTAQFGFLFVADLEDCQLHDLAERD
jgi:hypothetical protein